MDSALSEDAIRHRAYLLWEADGRPEGRDEHYWHLASSQLLVETVVPAPQLAAANKPASKPKTAARKVAKDDGHVEAKADRKSPATKPKKVTATSQGLGATNLANAKPKATVNKTRDSAPSRNWPEV